MHKLTTDRKQIAIEQIERELAEPLRRFRSALTTVAEQQMAKAQNRSAAPLPARSAWFRTRLVMALAPALLLLLLTVGLVLANDHHHRTAVTSNPVTAQNEPVATPQQVSDAALFTEIDEDLSSNVPQSMAPLEGAATSKTTHEYTMQVEENNGVEK